MFRGGRHNLFILITAAILLFPAGALAADEGAQQALNEINRYRLMGALPEVSLNRDLTEAAAAHAGYLANHNYQGHQQNPSHSDFTGREPWDRGKYFGYESGYYSEGISYGEPGAVEAIAGLLDAPYHRRAILDPHVQEIGYGTSQYPDGRAADVVEYGGDWHIEPVLVAYPFPNQRQVPFAWTANETPNPLRFFNAEGQTVGYPISLFYYDTNGKGRLVSDKVQLTDAEGRSIPLYVVDSGKDDWGQQHIFIIPRRPLSPRDAYRVDVSGSIVTGKDSRPFGRSWSFTTEPYRFDLKELKVNRTQGFPMVEVHYRQQIPSTVEVTITHRDEVAAALTREAQYPRGMTAYGSSLFRLEPGQEYTVDIKAVTADGDTDNFRGTFTLNKDGSTGFSRRSDWAPSDVRVFLSGQEVGFQDQTPVIANGRTLVPFRAVFNALGASVGWDNDTRTVTAVKGDTVVALEIGNPQALVNGTQLELDAAAEIIGGRAMVPLRFVGEAFGSSVRWFDRYRYVIIN